MRATAKPKKPSVISTLGFFVFATHYLVDFGVGMLGAFENLAGFALTISGQPAQQKKHRSPSRSQPEYAFSYHPARALFVFFRRFRLSK